MLVAYANKMFDASSRSTLALPVDVIMAVDMDIKNTAPPPANRPKFWRFCRERELTTRQIMEIFDRSDEWVRLVCLPFHDNKRRIPDQADIERIYMWSQGAIGPQDWYPPSLNAPAEQARAA